MYSVKTERVSVPGNCTTNLWSIFLTSSFGGLGVACWPLVPKFAGSNPAEAEGEKILSTPSFRGEVKPSVPCRRYAACKRSLNGVEVVILAKLPDNILTHSSTFCHYDLSRCGGRGGTWWRNWECLNAGESNGKLPPKNLPRMQCTRAIPVAWLSSGLCPNRPMGWMPIIVIIMIISHYLNRGHSPHTPADYYLFPKY